MRRLALILFLILAALATACSPAVMESSQTTNTLPLSEPGPYDVGQRKFNFTDPARDDRKVPVTLWYPAKRPFGSERGEIIRDAKPDLKEAPYPLILSSTKVAGQFAPYLVSHGFTWASVDWIDSYMALYQGAIDQPLDILFALDQMGDNPPEGLEGLIDSEHAGTIGYSFDGFNSLAMSGARVDPEYYLSQCPTKVIEWSEEANHRNFKMHTREVLSWILP